MRVCAVKGTSVASPSLAFTEVEPLLGEDDDRAAFRGLVGEARQLRRLGELELSKRPRPG